MNESNHWYNGRGVQVFAVAVAAMLGVYLLAWIAFQDARIAAVFELTAIGLPGFAVVFLLLGRRGGEQHHHYHSAPPADQSPALYFQPDRQVAQLPPPRQRVSVPVLNTPASYKVVSTPTTDGDIDANPEVLAFIAQYCFDRPSRPGIGNRLQMAGRAVGHAEIDAALDWYGAHGKLSRPAGAGGARKWTVSQEELTAWLTDIMASYGIVIDGR